MRFGEGPGDHEVRVAVQQGEPVPDGPVGDEIEVGLVDEHEHPLGHAVEQCDQLRLAQCRAGRIVGRARDDNAGARRDGVDHGRHVVAAVRGHRHLDSPRPGHGGADRVGLEGAPRHDDVVPLVAHGVQHVLDQADRPVADDDPPGAHTVALGDGGDERVPRHLRVAVGPGRRLGEGRQHLGLRGERQLIGRELGGTAGLRARSGHVGGQAADGIADVKRGGGTAHGVILPP